MSERSKYLVFAIEAYKKARKLNGAQVYDLFNKYGFFDYITDFYETLHIQGTRYLLEELDEYQRYQDSGKGSAKA
ncbi:MAG: DUF3791 domain-containing protein [Elusimicrobiota bacterium]|jgi:hypothetical protein|nr:DUF3791 domain-containing protein [Elusimicrobiota bacterium]